MTSCKEGECSRNLPISHEYSQDLLFPVPLYHRANFLLIWFLLGPNNPALTGSTLNLSSHAHCTPHAEG